MANQKQIEEKKKQNRTILALAGLLAVVLIALVLITQIQKMNAQKAAEPSAQLTGEGEMPSISHNVTITVRDYGTIRLELYENIAPVTVANFVKLAENGFYNGLTFHRIMKGFMIQGGDPAGNGSGGAEEMIVGEFSSNGHANPISHVRGALSMARATDPDSASSQFFIVQSDSLFLDGNYAGFGMVTSGIEVVDQIAQDARPVDDNGTIPPDAQPVIESITVEKVKA